MNLDVYDGMTMAGVVLLTIAMLATAGWPGLAGLWGVLLILVGLVGAHRAGRV